MYPCISFSHSVNDSIKGVYNLEENFLSMSIKLLISSPQNGLRVVNVSKSFVVETSVFVKNRNLRITRRKLEVSIWTNQTKEYFIITIFFVYSNFILSYVIVFNFIFGYINVLHRLLFYNGYRVFCRRKKGSKTGEREWSLLTTGLKLVMSIKKNSNLKYIVFTMYKRVHILQICRKRV